MPSKVCVFLFPHFLLLPFLFLTDIFLSLKKTRSSSGRITREFAESYLHSPRMFSQLEGNFSSLKQLLFSSIETGVLELANPSLEINDEKLDNIDWTLVGPFLTHVRVIHQKDVTSLPIGLAYLSPQAIKQIEFMTSENWRKLDKIKAGESAKNIIDYCKAKLEGGMVKMN